MTSTDPQIRDTVRPFYGWKLVAVFWVIILFNFAVPMFGLSVLSTYMVDQGGISRAAMGSTYSVFTIMSGVPAPLAALMVGRWGIRWTIALGNLLLVVGGAALAVLPATAFNLIFFAGCVLGMGCAIGGTLPATTGIAYWFRERRALAIAIALSASSVGGTICPPALQALIAGTGNDWRLGWWVIAGLATLAIAAALFLVVNQPGDIHQSAWGTGQEETKPHAAVSRVHITTENWSFGEVVRLPAFWLLVCCGTAATAGFTIFFGQGLIHIRDLGFPMSTAAALLSAAVIIGFVAHMSTGALGDRLDPQHIWAGGLAAQGIGTLLFISFNSLPMLITSIALIGAGTSISMLCVLAVIGNWFGAQAYAAVAGFTSAVTTVGALSSYIAGLSYDRWGSYLPAYLAVAVPCLVCAPLLFVTKPPRRR